MIVMMMCFGVLGLGGNQFTIGPGLGTHLPTSLEWLVKRGLTVCTVCMPSLGLYLKSLWSVVLAINPAFRFEQLLLIYYQQWWGKMKSQVSHNNSYFETSHGHYHFAELLSIGNSDLKVTYCRKSKSWHRPGAIQQYRLPVIKENRVTSISITKAKEWRISYISMLTSSFLQPHTNYQYNMCNWHVVILIDIFKYHSGYLHAISPQSAGVINFPPTTTYKQPSPQTV